MTGKQKFLNFISISNEFCGIHGYNTVREFIRYSELFNFGILKVTDTLDTGSVYVRYSLYGLHSFDEFFIIRSFEDLNIAEKALDVLTAY